MSVSARIRVGVISDTHGLLRPEALAGLAGSDHIVHAGDIGGADILAALRAIAPVTAVRGNNDRDAWARALPDTTTVELGGARLFVLHDLATLAVEPRALGVRVLIAGHSHRPSLAERDGVLYLKPGSAGPRRFRLPIAMATLTVRAGQVDAALVDLSAPAEQA